MKTKLMILFCLIGILFITGCGKKEAPSVVDGYLKYTLQEDGTYSVGAADKNNLPDRIEIPTEYNGIAVTAITKNGFARAPQLHEVIIPDHFEGIAEGAFYMCNNLQTVHIPNSVKYIDKGVFTPGPTISESGVEFKVQELTIYYDGTSEEWKKITKAGNYAEKLELYIICTDRSIYEEHDR